jgi:hypothetical protein
MRKKWMKAALRGANARMSSIARMGKVALVGAMVGTIALTSCSSTEEEPVSAIEQGKGEYKGATMTVSIPSLQLVLTPSADFTVTIENGKYRIKGETTEIEALSASIAFNLLTQAVTESTQAFDNATGKGTAVIAAFDIIDVSISIPLPANLSAAYYGLIAPTGSGDAKTVTGTDAGGKAVNRRTFGFDLEGELLSIATTTPNLKITISLEWEEVK